MVREFANLLIFFKAYNIFIYIFALFNTVRLKREQEEKEDKQLSS